MREGPSGPYRTMNYTYQLRFQKTFDLFNRIIQLFNKRRVPGEPPCKCHHINASINFVQTFSTDPEFQHEGEWAVVITSSQLGDRRFGGQYERVCQLVVEYLTKTALDILESMIANQSDWYLNDQDRTTILNLFHEINAGVVGLGGPV